MRTVAWQEWSCTVRVVAPEPDVHAVERIVRRTMERVAASVDRFDPLSDVSTVNAVAGTGVEVSPLTVTLVLAALDAQRESDGLVDPTVGGAVIAHGYDRDIHEVRRDAVATPLPWVADRTVHVDAAARRIGVPIGVALDLGAVAKAWTVDHAASSAAQRTGGPVLVEIGGDLAVAGAHDWVVKVAEREDQDGELVALHHGGLATSSTVARAWDTDAGRRHHLVDPRTGAPADGPWRTVSCWAPTAVEANRWSTAAVVAGDRALEILTRDGVAARLVRRDGFVVTTAAWPARRPHAGWAVPA